MMDNKELLRLHIREIAKKIKLEQKQSLVQENRLRRYIRKLLREVEEVSPHESTGVNVLEDLLKTIVPILEAGYKRLTSDVEQRQSFRAHILRAVQNLLSTESIYFRLDQKHANAKQGLKELKIKDTEKDTTPDSPEFIDIDKDKKEKAAKAAAPKPEDAFAPIAGADPTGRGFALRSFQKIQKQILDAYSLLGKDEDREVFYDYLITNLKLYFDKFEDELQKKLEEPTTPEYEEEKRKKQSSLSSGAEIASDDTEAGEEMAAGESEDTDEVDVTAGM